MEENKTEENKTLDQNKEAENEEVFASKYSKPQRIFAIIGIILLLLLYLVTLIVAITATPGARQLFVASIGATFIIPLLIFGYSKLAKLLTRR